MADRFLGIDFGTSGARSCLVDATGRILHEAQTAYSNAVDLQPADWQRALFDLLAGLPEPAKPLLSSIAIDGTSGTVLLVDEEGVAVGPALPYSDSRAVAEAQEIETRSGPHAAATPTSGLAKFLWLLKQPGSEKARHACHQADWLGGQLSGRFGVTDYHNALKSGYDLEALGWPDWISGFAIFRLLPQVVAPGESIGKIKPEIARRFGLNPNCTIKSGTTDSIAAFIAAGASHPGEAVTSLGTTLVLKLLSITKVDAPEYGIYSHKYGNLWLAGGASNSGGGVLRQFFSDEQLARLSADIDANQASGLDYYPLSKPGERFPVNNPTLPPRLEPRPENDVEFLHGLLEGMARIEALGYRRLEELGATPLKSVQTAGRGALNPTWQAIRQRHLKAPVTAAPLGEAAYGTARLARLGSAVLPSSPY